MSCPALVVLVVNPLPQVLDVGCGIGGPLREIVSFSGASVVGLNNNAYQVKRGQVGITLVSPFGVTTPLNLLVQVAQCPACTRFPSIQCHQCSSSPVFSVPAMATEKAHQFSFAAPKRLYNFTFSLRFRRL